MVNRSYFTRNVDELGDGAVISREVSELLKSPHSKSMFENNFYVAQFFELGGSESAVLEKFYHDRVWNFHAAISDYKTKYVPLPFSRNPNETNVENCVTFVYSFLLPEWSARRPEMTSLARQLGSISVDEIPSRQVFLNAENAAYRGTVFITAQPDGLEKAITRSEITEEKNLHQLTLKGPATKIIGNEPD